MAQDKEHCLFISDLHLCESRPQITQAFLSFLQSTAIHAQALYILGDLFEYWAGDDSIALGNHNEVITALKALSSHIRVFFMHGNRDFLIGEDFEKASGVNILSDPSCITLFGKSVLLSHGDKLCTDDVEYQKFREDVRTNDWKAQFLNQPLTARIVMIERLRAKSEQEKSSKSMQIMDVNPEAVKTILKQFGCPPLFIHGHTHRPNKHTHDIQNNICERWVLGDWYEQGSYLKLDRLGCHSQKLTVG